MAVTQTSPFDHQHPFAPDLRMQRETLDDRNSISEYIRWEGMWVYVKSERKTYQLVGGILNSQWQEIGSGGPGPGTYIPMTWVDTDGALTANSDQKIATQKAVKTYVDDSIAAINIPAATLTGFAVGANTAITAGDSILQAFGKAQGQINARVPTARTLTMSEGNGISITSTAPQSLAANRTWTFSVDTAYLDTQYIPLAQKGQPGGVATLDDTGKVPLPQLPDSVLGALKWKGLYDGSTITSSDNTINGDPLPAASAANEGWYFISTADYTHTGTQYHTGDWIISTGSAWEKVDNTDAVTSVFGRIGPIVAVATDYNAFYLRTDTAAQGLTGTQQNNAITNLGLDSKYYPLNSNPAGYITSADIPAPQDLGLTQAAGQITISGGNSVVLRDLGINPTGMFPDANVLPASSGIHPYAVTTATSSNYPVPAGMGLKFIRSGGSPIGYFELFKAVNYDDTIYYRTAADGTTFNPWRPIASQDHVAANYVTLATPQTIQSTKTFDVQDGDKSIIIGSHAWDYGFNSWPTSNGNYGGITEDTAPDDPNFPPRSITYAFAAAGNFPSINNGFNHVETRKLWSGNQAAWQFIYPYTASSNTPIYYRSAGATGSGWNDLRAIASQEWVQGLPGVAQALSLGVGAGQITISGGNSVHLKSLIHNVPTDFETYSPGQGLYPILNTTGSTGFPSPGGYGLYMQRLQNASDGSFAIWKNSANDGKLKFNVGTTGTTWKGWETFASEEFLALYGIGALIPTAGRPTDYNNILKGGLYWTASAAMNGPYATSTAVINIGLESNFNAQIALRDSRGISWRGSEGGVWGAWKEIWHSGNFDATEIQTDITAIEQDITAINQDLAAMDLNEVCANGSSTTIPVSFGASVSIRGNGGIASLYFKGASEITRFHIGTDSDAAGGDFVISRCNDAGVNLGPVLTLDRATGNSAFIGRVSGQAAQSATDFINGQNAGFGLTWNPTTSKLEFGAALVHEGNVVHTVPLSPNHSVSIGGDDANTPNLGISNGFSNQYSVNFGTGQDPNTGVEATFGATRDDNSGLPAAYIQAWDGVTTSVTNEIRVHPTKSETIKDFEISSSGGALILSDSTGLTKWRITIDNTGNLVTTQI